MEKPTTEEIINSALLKVPSLLKIDILSVHCVLFRNERSRRMESQGNKTAPFCHEPDNQHRMTFFLTKTFYKGDNLEHLSSVLCPCKFCTTSPHSPTVLFLLTFSSYTSLLVFTISKTNIIQQIRTFQPIYIIC